MAEYENWSVAKKLSKARAILAGKALKKSGVNRQRYQDKHTGEWKEIGFSYFELSDFLPETLKIFDEVGLCGVFKINPNHTEEIPLGDMNTVQRITYPETAELTIINSDNSNECIVFTQPTAQVDMRTAIQSLGAKKTYLRRYLWMDAMEIAENDLMDSQPVDGEEEKPLNTSAQYNQADMAVELTKVTGDLRNIGIDIHDEKVAEYICKEANVKSIDGGQLLTDLPGMARVISVMKVIAQKKAK